MRAIVVDNSAVLPLFLSDDPDDYAQLVFRESAAGESLNLPVPSSWTGAS